RLPRQGRREFEEGDGGLASARRTLRVADGAWRGTARRARISAMNIALRRTMTVAEYLAWGDALSERRRTELINGQIVAMSPERADHNRLKGRIYLALASAVSQAGLGCEAFTDGMTVPIDEHTAYEPDALVHCGAPIPAQQLTVPAPVVVVEVLSPTTRHSD